MNLNLSEVLFWRDWIRCMIYFKIAFRLVLKICRFFSVVVWRNLPGSNLEAAPEDLLKWKMKLACSSHRGTKIHWKKTICLSVNGFLPILRTSQYIFYLLTIESCVSLCNFTQIHRIHCRENQTCLVYTNQNTMVFCVVGWFDFLYNQSCEFE